MMYLPNYRDGSIVNLMSSIGAGFGLNSVYSSLKGLDIGLLSKKKNIILMVIDGLGFDYVCSKGKGSFLHKNLSGSITSVFPSTTASAITTFGTGLAPKQHAMVGWFTYLKELGVISAVLRMQPRYGGESFESAGIRWKDIFDTKEFWKQINASSFNIMPKEIVGEDKKKGRMTVLSFNTLRQLVSQVKKAIIAHNRRKYIYCYWPMFDKMSHLYGVGSKEAFEHFKEIDCMVSSLAEKIKDTDTVLIVTADHGFIDSPKSKMIDLSKHSEFLETLSMPLSGDSRVKYCYVRPSKEKQFLSYYKRHLSRYCYLFRSDELLNKNFFGLFEPHKRLFERIGDYVLVMKENYAMKDPILSKRVKPEFVGYHSGVSRQEMIVPLVIVNL